MRSETSAPRCWRVPLAAPHPTGACSCAGRCSVQASWDAIDAFHYSIRLLHLTDHLELLPPWQAAPQADECVPALRPGQLRPGQRPVRAHFRAEQPAPRLQCSLSESPVITAQRGSDNDVLALRLPPHVRSVLALRLKSAAVPRRLRLWPSKRLPSR